MHEIVQLSIPADQKMTAEMVSHNLSQQSMDIVSFVKPVSVGDILEFRAQITYVCPKSNRVRVRVVCETINPLTGKSLTPDENQANTFQMTYHVKEIKLK